MTSHLRLEPRRHPWERKPDESAKAFTAFGCYRDMGPTRSLDSVARQCAKSASLIRRWSRRHGWVDRAEAHDDHLARIRQHAAEEELRERAEAMARRHAGLLAASIQAMSAPGLALLERMRTDPDSLARLDTPELARLSRYCAWVLPHLCQAERVARGLPADAPVASDPDVESSAVPVEEVAKMIGELTSAIVRHNQEPDPARRLELIEQAWGRISDMSSEPVH